MIAFSVDYSVLSFWASCFIIGMLIANTWMSGRKK
jgi:hypothetical protein